MSRRIASTVNAATSSGWLGTAGMPVERINIVNAAVNKILMMPEMKKFFDSEAAEPWPRTPVQLDGFLIKEIERYRKAAQLAGIEPQ